MVMRNENAQHSLHQNLKRSKLNGFCAWTHWGSLRAPQTPSRNMGPTLKGKGREGGGKGGKGKGGETFWLRHCITLFISSQMTTIRLSISLPYSCWSVPLTDLGNFALITDWWLGNWCLGVWVPVRFKPGISVLYRQYTHPFSSAYTTTNRINRNVPVVPVHFRAIDLHL